MSSALVRVLAASAILKAGGVGEFIRIAAAELALKKAFKRLHRKAVGRILAAIRVSPPTPAQADRFTARARLLYESVYLNGSEKLLEAHIGKVYELNKKSMVRRIQGKIKGDYVYDYSAAFRKAERPENPSFVFDFSFIDRRAIDAILNGHFYWYGDHFDKNISEVIKRVIADKALTAGLGRVEAGRALQRELKREFALTGGGRELAVPSGWRGTFDKYFEMLAASVTTAARAASTVQAVREAGGSKITIMNPMDERTCPRCAVMHGKTFTIDQAGRQFDALSRARGVDDMKKAQPWYSTKEFLEIGDKKGYVSDDDSARFAAAGIVLPPYHGTCFVPGTIIQGRVQAGSVARYAGPVVEIKTREGRCLTVTANHPVLTRNGFAVAFSLENGDNVIGYSGGNYIPPLAIPAPHKQYEPALVEEVLQLLRKDRLAVGIRMGVRPEDLHGDGERVVDREVYVVAGKGKLRDHGEAICFHGETDLTLEQPRAGRVSHPGHGEFLKKSFVACVPSTGCPGRSALALDLGIGIDRGFDLLPLQALCFGSAADLDASLLEPSDQGGSGDVDLVGEFFHRSSGKVALDEVIQVRHYDFCGHVYSLESPLGWVVADGVITSNCRCTVDLAPDAEI